MKKLVVFLAIFIFGQFASATTVQDVQKFFNSYVNAANSYSTSYFSYFSTSPIIKRVVIKKDGTTETVVVPFDMYKKHSKISMKVGKLTHYSNTYTNIKIIPNGKVYKITAMRKPSTSNYQLPASFVVGKDASGNLKIKEESMHTKVQSFLKKKNKDNKK